MKVITTIENPDELRKTKDEAVALLRSVQLNGTAEDVQQCQTWRELELALGDALSVVIQYQYSIIQLIDALQYKAYEQARNCRVEVISE